MEEKILVKSQQYNAKKGMTIVLCVVLAIIALICVGAIISCYAEAYEDSMEYYSDHWHEDGCWCEDYFSASDYARGRALGAMGYWWREILYTPPLLVFVIFMILVLIAGMVVYLWLKSYEMVVTDKRTYGKVAFGKRVDLPNDSISAISMAPLFKGVAVATSSGKISFLLIKNADEVYDAVNKLLMERQEKKAEPVVVATPTPSNASELKQYKELLDSGAITQEEFDAKKKQLLGL